MRPLLAGLLTALLLLGTAAYTQFARQVKRPPISLETDTASGDFEIEIARSFDAVPDQFAELPALEITYRGQAVYTVDEPLGQQTPVRIRLPNQVETGSNEINVMANREILETQLAAIRVTVYRNQMPIVREAIISDPDLSTLNGTVIFESPPEVDHDH